MLLLLRPHACNVVTQQVMAGSQTRVMLSACADELWCLQHGDAASERSLSAASYASGT